MLWIYFTQHSLHRKGVTDNIHSVKCKWTTFIHMCMWRTFRTKKEHQPSGLARKDIIYRLLYTCFQKSENKLEIVFILRCVVFHVYLVVLS